MNYQRVLVPTDFSEASMAMVRFACGLSPFGVKSVKALNVIDTHGLESPVAKSKKAESSARMKEALKGIDFPDVQVTGEVRTGPAAACVLRAATDLKADLILMGSTGKKPMQELLLGSLSEQVTREAEIPVLFVRFRALAGKTPQQIAAMASAISDVVLHPTDFSECSGRALDAVLDLKPGRVVIATAVDAGAIPGDEVQAVEEEGKRRLGTIQHRIERHGMPVQTRHGLGDPATVMLKVCDQDPVTLIVLGSRGKGLVTESIIGSVSADILRRATVPVMVIH